MDNKESIWIKNPINLLTYYDNFSIYSPNNKCNAVTRLLMMSGLIFVLFGSKSWSYICLIGILLVTIIGYIYDEHLIEVDGIVREKEYLSCRHSTIDNPMGNLLPYSLDPTNSACNEDENVKTDNLFFGHYRNQNDHINRETMKNFITLPVTNIEGKRSDFLNFIYNGYDGEYKSCKYDGVDCERYRDLRFDV